MYVGCFGQRKKLPAAISKQFFEMFFSSFYGQKKLFEYFSSLTKKLHKKSGNPRFNPECDRERGYIDSLGYRLIEFGKSLVFFFKDYLFQFSQKKLT